MVLEVEGVKDIVTTIIRTQLLKVWQEGRGCQKMFIIALCHLWMTPTLKKVWMALIVCGTSTYFDSFCSYIILWLLKWCSFIEWAQKRTKFGQKWRSQEIFPVIKLGQWFRKNLFNIKAPKKNVASLFTSFQNCTVAKKKQKSNEKYAFDNTKKKFDSCQFFFIIWQNFHYRCNNNAILRNFVSWDGMIHHTRKKENSFCQNV